MAGQSPEPSFQPAGQDPNVTQGRPSWQIPPGYTPPGGGTAGGGEGGGQAYAQSYPPQDQAYPPQDQTFTVMGQNSNQGYQDYQGYQQQYQGYGANQGQGAPGQQWDGPKGMKPAGSRSKSQGEAGFLGSLFDFSFNSFVTPKIIKALYVLITVWTALLALAILITGFRIGGIVGGLITLFIVEPIFILLTLGIYRVVLEAFMVVFRLYEETKKIRENGESRG